MTEADSEAPEAEPVETPATVQVAVRVRPYSERERLKNEHEGVGVCVRMEKPHKGEVKLIAPDGHEYVFNFDFSYWSHDGFEVDESTGRTVPKEKYDGKYGTEYVDQECVFADLGLPILKGSLAGRDACIFAYGQTGSGKSYSVFGPPSDPGIIPMAGKAIFELGEQNSDVIVHVEISVLEIYNEIVRDLLNFDPPKKKFGPERDPGLRIVQKPSGIEVLERRTVVVGSYAEIEQLIDAAMAQRTIASTLMNATSSRAHTVFALQVQKVQNEEITKSTINLVDLAGSERSSKTGAKGDRLKEGAAINRSLMALGLVISKLVQRQSGAKNIHINFRDSKLTHLLQDSLSGKGQTVMIAAISPSADNYEETLSTLKFADRMKQIKVTVVAHVLKSREALEKELERMKEEVTFLYSQLSAAGIVVKPPASFAPPTRALKPAVATDALPLLLPPVSTDAHAPKAPSAAAAPPGMLRRTTGSMLKLQIHDTLNSTPAMVPSLSDASPEALYEMGQISGTEYRSMIDLSSHEEVLHSDSSFALGTGGDGGVLPGGGMRMQQLSRAPSSGSRWFSVLTKLASSGAIPSSFGMGKGGSSSFGFDSSQMAALQDLQIQSRVLEQRLARETDRRERAEAQYRQEAHEAKVQLVAAQEENQKLKRQLGITEGVSDAYLETKMELLREEERRLAAVAAEEAARKAELLDAQQQIATMGDHVVRQKKKRPPPTATRAGSGGGASSADAEDDHEEAEEEEAEEEGGGGAGGGGLQGMVATGGGGGAGVGVAGGSQQELSKLNTEEIRLTEELERLSQQNARLQQQMHSQLAEQQTKEHELASALASAEEGKRAAIEAQIAQYRQQVAGELDKARLASEELERARASAMSDRELVMEERNELQERAQRDHAEAARKLVENMDLYRRIDQLTAEKAALLGGEQLAPDQVKERYKSDALAQLGRLMAVGAGRADLGELERELKRAHGLGAAESELRPFRDFAAEAKRAHAEEAVRCELLVAAEPGEGRMTAADVERMERALADASSAEVSASVVAQGKVKLLQAKKALALEEASSLEALLDDLGTVLTPSNYARAAALLKEMRLLELPDASRAPLFTKLLRRGLKHIDEKMPVEPIEAALGCAPQAGALEPAGARLQEEAARRLPGAHREQALAELQRVARMGTATVSKLDRLETAVARAERHKVDRNELKKYRETLSKAQHDNAVDAIHRQLKLRVRGSCAAEMMEPLRGAIATARAHKVDSALLEKASQRLEQLQIASMKAEIVEMLEQDGALDERAVHESIARAEKMNAAAEKKGMEGVDARTLQRARERLSLDAFQFGEVDEKGHVKYPFRVDVAKASKRLDDAEKAAQGGGAKVLDKRAMANLRKELQRIQTVQAEAEEGSSCQFYLLSADKVRHSTANRMLTLQEMRNDPRQRTWLHRFTVSARSAVKQELAQYCLVVSHRWEKPSHPDPNGIQLQRIREHLCRNPTIRFVWWDFACMPQKELQKNEDEETGEVKLARSEEDQREFNLMLQNMSLLFLTSKVLILNDHQYVGRFWCKYESFLAMQVPTFAGMVPIDKDDVNKRYELLLLYEDDSDFLNQILIDQWLGAKGAKNVEDMISHLSRDDVYVTNQKDKPQQFEKIRAFDETVKALAKELGLAHYVKSTKLARDIASKNMELADEAEAKAKQLEGKAKEQARLGNTAAALDAESKAKEQRVKAEREKASANRRAETRLAAAIAPINKKLKTTTAKNKQLTQENGELLKRVEKLQAENKELMSKFYVKGAGGVRPGSVFPN